jgi:hypothetical protein
MQWRKRSEMNFAVFDERIDALSARLASATKEEDAQMLADKLAYFIWLKAEMSRKIVQVGALAHA